LLSHGGSARSGLGVLSRLNHEPTAPSGQHFGWRSGAGEGAVL
jgi:hypothetical protein